VIFRRRVVVRRSSQWKCECTEARRLGKSACTGPASIGTTGNITHFATAAEGYVVHNGESFFVRHAYFTGAGESYEKLQRRVTS